MTQTFLSNQLALGNAYYNPYVKLYAWYGTTPFTSILQMLPAEQLTVVREGDLCLVRDPAATAQVLWRCTSAANQTALVWEAATNDTDIFVDTAVLVAPSTLRLTRNDAVNVDVDLSTLVSSSPALTHRQGGSATEWNIGGATNYPVSNMVMYIGSVDVTFLTGDITKEAVITFPTPFAERPFVTASVVFNQLFEQNCVINSIIPTPSGCSIFPITGDRVAASTGETVRIHWIAIGQAA